MMEFVLTVQHGNVKKEFFYLDLILILNYLNHSLMPIVYFFFTFFPVNDVPLLCFFHIRFLPLTTRSFVNIIHLESASLF